MEGHGYHEFNGNIVWHWPPLYSIYLAGWQRALGVSGRTLARANMALAVRRRLRLDGRFLLPFGESLDDARRRKPLSLIFPLLAAGFIAGTLVAGFHSALAHNLVYTLYPIAAYLVHRATRPDATAAATLRFSLPAAVFLSLLLLSHNSVVVIPIIVGTMLLLHRTHGVVVRWTSAFIAGFVPLAVWLADRIYLNQLNSHTPGFKPKFSKMAYAHQLLTGISQLFGPNRHRAGLILLACTGLIVVFYLLKSRRRENSGRDAIICYLLIAGGLLGAIYAEFNSTFIYEELYSDRFLLFVPLTLFPSAVMLYWQNDLAETEPASTQGFDPAPGGPNALGMIWKLAALLILCSATIGAGARAAQKARKYRFNAGPVDAARVHKDRGFAYNRMTLNSDYWEEKLPPREQGKLILVPPFREGAKIWIAPKLMGKVSR